ncbi:GNAT family N-acetyltransferase [Heyndrickxia sp. NPDC080065]|uniref:GNAT family N-acetyltransferase n=1 Tax=Heyndrickxia sp. NPDC080065 TaxID=3390568 RepID=UPI003CFE767E
MYKRVTNQEELNVFHQIKQVSWEGKGFDMEYAKEGSDLFLFYGDDDLPGGTFEFTPYPQFTSPFMKNLFNDVVQKNMVTVEIDSFSVLPKYRGKLGREIICFLLDYAKKTGYTHAVAISDPAVFRSFNKTYHIRATQVKEQIWYKGDYVIPALFHLQEAYDNIHDEKFSWFKQPIEKKEGVLL